jgi:hypothetical protein
MRKAYQIEERYRSARIIFLVKTVYSNKIAQLSAGIHTVLLAIIQAFVPQPHLASGMASGAFKVEVQAGGERRFGGRALG